MKAVHKSFHLQLFAIFSSIDENSSIACNSRRPNLSQASMVSVMSLRHFFFLLILYYL